MYIYILLLQSRFSRVQLCATPWTAAHQARPSLGFSRQEHWSGLPFPSPVHGSEKWKWSGSVVSDSLRPHGPQPTRFLRPWIVQARALEWGAIAFSNYIGKMWWINLFSFKVLPFSVFHSCTLVLEKEIHWKSLQTWGVWRRMEEWFLQAQSISDELVIIPLEQKLNLEFKNKLYILF